MSLPRRVSLATAALLPATLVLAPAVSAHAATAAFPAHYAAPYLQLSSSTVGDLSADKAASGDAFYSPAFLIPQSGCTPMWEDGNYALGQFTAQVNTFKAAGGNVIVSSGGAEGGELAQTCTSVTSLTAAYAGIVSAYGPRLDFDIEGSPLDDTASIARRDQALAALQAQNPAVQVDFTLPVAPDGLESNALNLLKDAKAKGVKVNLVNIMTMDFGDGQNALADAESGANATHTQLGSIFTGQTSAQLWNLIGLTPIAGQNDDNENFTQGNASTLESFAASNGVQELAFWEVDEYDKATGYAYSRIFNAITGGGSTPTTPVISLRAHANGKYVTAGSSALIANASSVGTAQKFDEVSEGGNSIALRAHVNNDFVCADNYGNDPLIANRTAASQWETFTLIHNADGSISLQAAVNGDYVTAENAGASALIANRTAIAGWEEFDLASA